MIVQPNPDNYLVSVANEIVWGNLAVTCGIRGNDEIGALVYVPLWGRLKQNIVFRFPAPDNLISYRNKIIIRIGLHNH
jgi:hypothetical protein